MSATAKQGRPRLLPFVEGRTGNMWQRPHMFGLVHSGRIDHRVTCRLMASTAFWAGDPASFWAGDPASLSEHPPYRVDDFCRLSRRDDQSRQASPCLILRAPFDLI